MTLNERPLAMAARPHSRDRASSALGGVQSSVDGGGRRYVPQSATVPSASLDSWLTRSARGSSGGGGGSDATTVNVTGAERHRDLASYGSGQNTMVASSSPIGRFARTRVVGRSGMWMPLDTG